MCQTVTLLLDDGRELKRQIEFPKDKPEYGAVQIEAKFNQLAEGVLNKDKRDGLKDMISIIDELDDINSLSKHLY